MRRPQMVGWLFLGLGCITQQLTRQKVYVGRLDSTNGTDVIIEDSGSEIHCATQCAHGKPCRRFSYNDDQKKCYMSRDKLGETLTGGNRFGQYFPMNLLYGVKLVGLSERCIKLHQVVLNYTDASKLCMSEGGHLFTMETPFDVFDLTTRVNGGQGWIDGGTELKTWYGEPLPFVGLLTVTTGHCPSVNSTGLYLKPLGNLGVPICQVDL